MLKLMYNLLLGDFDEFNEALSEEATGTDVFIFLLFFALYYISCDYNAKSINCFCK